MSHKKITIGMFSLTGCEGCYFAVLDLREKFLELKNKVEFKNFRLFEDTEHFPSEQYDYAFVEGSPITKDNIKRLRQIRKHSDKLVAFGGCAHIGGIYHMKKYVDKDKAYNHVYGQEKGIDNLDVQPIDKIVRVDYVIPGCPVTPKEFLQFIYKVILGAEFEITQNPVCYECQSKGYKCVLMAENQVCLGPISQGGCEAICLKSGQGCWGCRGLVEDAEVDNLVKLLRKNHSNKEITKFFEVFGVKELINK
ncbi:hypothetical protein HN958_01625 [Candidatus Falkowbacteria bacterium]|jgi:sulfhydrogenase subunit delta|nr:hypothetical protein [Candidatus Falkowbacteria bacterium]MBT7007184.1 hypothetical protein [Candidatus Falkowbacteria bacterium]